MKAVLAVFATDPQAAGLSEEQAKQRLERFGKNELAAERPISAWRRFVGRFSDALMILLLAAALISAALWVSERQSGLPYEAMAIFAIVLLNALMGHFQQVRAESALAALRRTSAARANVAPHQFGKLPFRFGHGYLHGRPLAKHSIIRYFRLWSISICVTSMRE